MSGSTTNKCSVCGLSYLWHLESGVTDTGDKWCRHDEADCNVHFDVHDQKIISKLPPGQVLVKGSDGVSRVCSAMPKREYEKQNEKYKYQKKQYENKHGKRYRE